MNYFLSLLFIINTIGLFGSEEVIDIVKKGFPEVSTSLVKVHELKGGLSGTCLYKIDLNNKSYVLRLHKSLVLNTQDQRELYAMSEAAKKELSPPMIFVSEDKKAVIMEFINTKTLSIEQANHQENVIKIANAIRLAHQINDFPVEGEEILSKASRCYKKVLKDGLMKPDEITKTYNLILKYHDELSKFNNLKVNIHGDLNPRNIFLTNKVFFIDWAESVFDDPFHELGYFALKLNYNQENESLLLKTYLMRDPSKDELKRYELRKKLLQAFWSLTDLYLADAELKKHPEQKIDSNTHLKKWGDYQRTYAENMDLPAQHFYELSRLNALMASSDK